MGYHDSLNWLKIMLKQWLKALKKIVVVTKNRVLLYQNLRQSRSRSQIEQGKYLELNGEAKLTTPRRKTTEILPSSNVASKSSAFRWSYTLSGSVSEMPSRQKS
jgi:hypothetical protein